MLGTLVYISNFSDMGRRKYLVELWAKCSTCTISFDIHYNPME